MKKEIKDISGIGYDLYKLLEILTKSCNIITEDYIVINVQMGAIIKLDGTSGVKLKFSFYDATLKMGSKTKDFYDLRNLVHWLINDKRYGKNVEENLEKELYVYN